MKAKRINKEMTVITPVKKEELTVKGTTRLQPLDLRNIVNMSMKTISGIKQRLIAKKPDVMLINMELRNGSHDSFLINATSNSFDYCGGHFVIDNDMKFYHIPSGFNALSYHQNFTLPIKQSIPIDKINAVVTSSGICDVSYSTNPNLLEKFITARIAEGVMKSGGTFDEYLKQMKLILIITMIASIGMLILFIVKTGMLKSISLAGILPH